MPHLEVNLYEGYSYEHRGSALYQLKESRAVFGHAALVLIY